MADYYDLVYADLATARYTTSRRRPLFEEFLRREPAPAGGRLLDIGCGEGTFVRLAGQYGWDAWGVETSMEAVAAARSLGLNVELGRFSTEGVAKLPFYTEGFDVVTLWNVIEFFPRPLEQLREIARVLAPGARLFVRTPNGVFHVLAYRLSRMMRGPRVIAETLRRAFFFNPLLWSAPSLSHYLRAAGFASLEIRNRRLSVGDPYRIIPRERERRLQLVKHALYATVAAASVMSLGRLTLGPSLAATATKPRDPARRTSRALRALSGSRL